VTANTKDFDDIEKKMDALLDKKIDGM